MSATRAKEPRLSDDDVASVIALIKESDTVELKLTVPESDHRSTVAALDMDPLDAQIRQVFFFDTPGPGAERERRRGPRPTRTEER